MEKRKALVIAISEYDNLPRARQLPFCKNDGNLVNSTLQSLGYYIPDNFKLIGYHTGEQIKKAIIDFFLRSAEAEDTLLLYFSGHGIPNGIGGHFLSSSNIDPSVPEDNGFSFLDLQNLMKRSIALKKVAILDCCFSGATEITMGGEEDGAAQQRGDMESMFEEGKGICILASSLGGQQSYKMKDVDMSVFTRFLVDGLNGGSGKSVNQWGIVTPSTLGDYIYRQMVRYQRVRRQTPVMKTSMSGDIKLASYPELAIPADLAAMSRYGDPNWFLEEGISQYEEGNYSNAVINFDRAIEKDRNFTDAYTNKGYALIHQGKDAEAFKCFDKATDLIPNDESLWRNKAFALINLDRYDEAIKCFDKALGISPNYAEALHGMGFVMIKTAKYDEAIKCFDKALGISPNYAEALHGMGLVLTYLRKFDDALRYYGKAIEILPKSRTILFGKAFVLVILGLYDEAMKCFDNINLINSTDEYGWFGRASALAYFGFHDEAINYFDEALTRSPNSKLLLYGKAFSLVNLGRYDEALNHFDKAIAVDYDYLDAWHGKAFVLLNQGRYTESMQCFNKILVMSPDDALARIGIEYANNGSWLVLNG